MTPEQKARQQIDQLLRQSGWEVQDYGEMNITRPAIAVREFPLKTGWADYLLLVDGQAIGAVEAKKAGTTLIGVEPQSKKYGEGLPDFMRLWVDIPPNPPREGEEETRFFVGKEVALPEKLQLFVTVLANGSKNLVSGLYEQLNR